MIFICTGNLLFPDLIGPINLRLVPNSFVMSVVIYRRAWNALSRARTRRRRAHARADIDEDPSGEAAQSILRQHRVYIKGVRHKERKKEKKGERHIGGVSMNVKALNAKIVLDVYARFFSLRDKEQV